MNTSQKEFSKVQEAVSIATNEQREKLIAANKAAANEILSFIANKYASQVVRTEIGTIDVE